MSKEKEDDLQLMKSRRKAELTTKLTRTLHEIGPDAARPYAEELAELIGEEGRWNRVLWADIWETRGRLDKSIEVADRDIAECVAALETRASLVGNISALREDVEDLLDAYYFQAKRYLDLGISGAAKKIMLEAHEHSLRYGVPFDGTLQDLFDQLCEDQY